VLRKGKQFLLQQWNVGKLLCNGQQTITSIKLHITRHFYQATHYSSLLYTLLVTSIKLHITRHFYQATHYSSLLSSYTLLVTSLHITRHFSTHYSSLLYTLLVTAHYSSLLYTLLVKRCCFIILKLCFKYNEHGALYKR
jgi:hypothetical protein